MSLLPRAKPFFSQPPPAASRARAALRKTLTSAGTLLVWFQTPHAMARGLTALHEGGREGRVEEGCVRLRLLEGEAPATVAALVAALSQDESEQTRALHVAGLGEPRLAEFGGILSLRALDLVARSSGLIDQLDEGRLTSWFHPILEARAPHKVFAHEALLRGLDRDGNVQSPEPLLTLARAAGLLPALDTAACRSAIRATALHAPGRVFINFSPAAVEDPERHLRSVEQAVDEAGLPRSQVVFEVVEADRIDDTAQLEAVLKGYRSAGFSVALDDLGAGWSTLNLVHRLRPDFIKLDRELVHGVHLNPVKGMIAGKLLEICQGLGISSIVEGVEVEEELGWVCAHGADFVQGFLFGRPAETPRSQAGAA